MGGAEISRALSGPSSVRYMYYILVVVLSEAAPLGWAGLQALCVGLCALYGGAERRWDGRRSRFAPVEFFFLELHSELGRCRPRDPAAG